MEKIAFVSCILLFVVINCVLVSGENSNQSHLTNDSAIGESVENVDNVLQPLACIYIPGLVVGNRTRELECCNEIEIKYKYYWSKDSLSLTKHLETLREWRCPQFHEQCRDRIFNFTIFTDLVYDYFCDYTALVGKCLPILNQTLKSLQNGLVSSNYGNNDGILNLNGHRVFETEKEWKILVSSMRSNQMTIDDLLKPCIQVAQYEQEKLNDGDYQEVINFLIPFCQLTWYGFSSNIFQERDISTWTCLPKRFAYWLYIIVSTIFMLNNENLIKSFNKK